MGIDFKMIKIHEIVVDSGPICKKSAGKILYELRCAENKTLFYVKGKICKWTYIGL